MTKVLKTVAFYLTFTTTLLFAENLEYRVFKISDKWLAVVFDLMPYTDHKILQDDPQFWAENMVHWRNYDQGGKIKWENIKAMSSKWQDGYLKFSHFHQLLGNVDSYKLVSKTDEDYKNGQSIVQAHCWVGSGGDRLWKNPKIRSEYKFQVMHTAYVKTPKILKQGNDYTLQIESFPKVQFSVSKLLSPSIKVNQEGYLPTADKFAYLGQWIPENGAVDFRSCKAFQLCEVKSDKIVFEGSVDLRQEDTLSWGERQQESYSGENIYSLNFSKFRIPGEYYINVPGVGKSLSFVISDDVLNYPFYTAVRGLYHQRCGCELSSKTTLWTRHQCHVDGVHRSSFTDEGINWQVQGERSDKKVHHFDFKAIAQTMDKSTKLDVTGGWHDAADYDKRKYHHQVIWDLLGTYEMNPKVFKDKQQTLPESGNGIPDILDEAVWGLKVWLETQNVDGAVSGRIETIHHPSHRGMPEQDKDLYAVSKADPDSTFHFAASAAWLSRLLKPYSQELSDKYLLASKKAFTWARENFPMKHEIQLNINDQHSKVQGNIKAIYKPKAKAEMYPAMLASLNLYLATEDLKFRQILENDYVMYCLKNFKAESNYRKFYWAIYLYAIQKKGLARAYQLKAGLAFDSLATEFSKVQDSIPYRHTWYHEKSRRWGSGLSLFYAAFQALNWKLTGDEKYKNAALKNIDFHFGCNPLGTVQTSGIGKIYVSAIMDHESRVDNLEAPVPGITTFGVIESGYHFRNNVYRMKSAKGQWVNFLPDNYYMDIDSGKVKVPLWRQYGPTSWYDAVSNEFTINETMGSLIVALGVLIPKEWQPQQKWQDESIRRFNRFWLP